MLACMSCGNQQLVPKLKAGHSECLLVKSAAMHGPQRSLEVEICLCLYVFVLSVKCKNDYSVQNDESLHGHCTNERRDRKRDKKVRRDVI